VRRSAPSACRRSAPLIWCEGRLDKPRAQNRAARTKEAALKTKHSRHPDKTTAAQKEAQAKRDADPDPTTLRRFLCTQFKFWHVCTRKACRRALKCSGDPHACFALWWPHVPEEIKILYRAGIKARCAGLSPREAARVATAEVARWRELEKQYGEPDAGAGAPAATIGEARPVAEPEQERMVARVRVM
jgi:hypothetical protein